MMKKSKKRKRSHSRDRLAVLEERVSKIFDMLSHSEVRTHADPSSSTPVTPLRMHADKQGSRPGSESHDLSPEVVYESSPAGRDDLTDPISGVYVIAGFVFEKYRRHDRHNHYFPEDSLTLDLHFFRYGKYHLRG